jgi:Flp pilus assembly protein TadD
VQCPADATIHSGLGAALDSEGHTEAAEAEFRAALQIDAHDFTALFNLGSLALQANQPQQAANFLEGAIQQRPKDPDAHQRLAEAYALSGRIDDAVGQLREAIALSPANPDLHALLSQALASTGQLEQAIAERKAALHLRATDADDWNNLGVLEAKAGRIAEAREDFLHALQISPNHAQARTNLQRLPPS